MQTFMMLSRAYAFFMIAFGVISYVGALLTGAFDALPFFAGTLASAICLAIVTRA